MIVIAPLVRVIDVLHCDWFADRWTINDVDEETNIITLLKPYTQYAIYVQTYTVAPQNTGKRVGARSDIIYVRTDPAGQSLDYLIYCPSYIIF